MWWGRFKSCIQKKRGGVLVSTGCHLWGLVSSEVEGLEIPFSEEKIFVALSDLGKDKAPGLDGFTMLFGFFVGMW